MVVETPPRGSTEQLDQAELEALVEALIEEARRRARRRRLRNAAVVLLAGMAAAGAYLVLGRDGNGGTLTGGAEPEAAVAVHSTAEWSPSGGPYGGPVYGFAAATGDRIFAATASGVFRSVNGGQTWVRAGLDGMQIVSVAADRRRVYAARVQWEDTTLHEEVYRSLDAGRTWVFLPASARQLTLSAADTWTVYAATAGHLVRSDDGGERWQPADTGLPSTSIVGLATDPADGRTVYAAAGQILKSTDGGTTWSALSDAIGAGVVALDGRTLYAAGERGVFASPDGGTTWQQRNASMHGDRAIGALTIARHALYASTYCAGVFRSLDGGRTWRSVNTGLPVHCPFSPSPVVATSRALFVGFERGAFTSSDGTRWQHADAGLSLSTPSAIAAPGSATAYAAAGGLGLFRSADAGRHWQALAARLDVARFVVAEGQLVLASGTGAHVQLSNDGGRTWQNASRGLGGNGVTALALSGSTAYAGTGGGVFAGDGRSWRRLGPTKTPVFAVAAAGDTIYAGSLGTRARGLYRSLDAGRTWQRVSPKDVEAVAIDPAKPTTVYAATADGLVVSGDGGATWHAANSGLPRLAMKLTTRTGVVSHVTVVDWLRALVLDPAHPRRLYVGTAHNGVYTSRDGGASWHPLKAGLPVLRIKSLQLAADSHTLYAGLESGGVVTLRVR